MANDGLKHVVHRRVHLERSQPEYRKRKVGQYLEKKTDYKKRAERYHVREKIIKELSSKTRFRNEDEFNYKMIHSRIGDEGQIILESEESAKKRKLNKKQQVKSDLNNIDLNLFVLNHKQNIIKKKLENMIGSNPSVVKSSKPEHIIFDLEEDKIGDDNNVEERPEDEEDKEVHRTKESRKTNKDEKVEKYNKRKKDKVKERNKKHSSNSNISYNTNINMDTDELFKLSDTFDKNKELEIVRNKLEDRRNLTIAKYKKRQVKRVRNSNMNTNNNVRVHKYVTQRLK